MPPSRVREHGPHEATRAACFVTPVVDAINAATSLPSTVTGKRNIHHYVLARRDATTGRPRRCPRGSLSDRFD